MEMGDVLQNFDAPVPVLEDTQIYDVVDNNDNVNENDNDSLLVSEIQDQKAVQELIGIPNQRINGEVLIDDSSNTENDQPKEVIEELKDNANTENDQLQQIIEEVETINSANIKDDQIPTIDTDVKAKEKVCEKKSTKEKWYKLKVASLSTPMDRRMQTLSVVSFWWYMPFSILLFIIMSLFPPFWIILIPYVIYMMYDNAPQRGGRRIQWLREHSWWNYFRDYFPAQLIKEEDLDPSKNYVFGYHPHGIISLGAFANFATEATGFSEQFKGITCSLCTLTTNFKIPFLREFLMGLGAVAVSKKSINHILNSGPGKSVAIVIGGAAESLDARPKTNDLTLKKRKGFVKIALQSGASLVPVFCFGENDLFHQVSNPKGSDIRTKQEEMIKTLGFAVPLFFGRGIFQYSFGLVPIRKPLVAVFGKAIDLPKIENPTLEEVQKYHTIYLEALSELYHRHKGLYASDRRSSINFVG